MKLYISKLWCVLLSISPIIDMLTGFCKLTGVGIENLSLIYKMIVFFIGVYICVHRHYKRIVFGCALCMFISISCIWHMIGVNRFFLVVTDIGSYIKLIYFIIVYYVFKELNKTSKKVLLEQTENFYLYFVPLSIIIPKIFGIGFYTYKGIESGYKGFYFGGNGINILLVLLMLLSGYKLIKTKTLLHFIILLGNIIANMLIGTKTSILSIICLILFFLLSERKFLTKTQKIILIVVFTLLILGFLIMNSEFFEAIFLRIKWEFRRVDGNYIDFITNSRIRQGMPFFIKKIKNRSFFLNILLGTGFAEYVDVLEMDYMDILLHNGIVMLIIISGFCLARFNKTRSTFIKYAEILAFGYAFFAGHLMYSPMGSVVLSFLLLEGEGYCEENWRLYIQN